MAALAVTTMKQWSNKGKKQRYPAWLEAGEPAPGEGNKGHGLVQIEEESKSSPTRTYTEMTMMMELGSDNGIQQESERLLA